MSIARTFSFANERFRLISAAISNRQMAKPTATAGSKAKATKLHALENLRSTDEERTDSPPEIAKSSAQKWLVGSAFDMLFVCGIAPWLLGLITFFVVGRQLNAPIPSVQQQALAITFIVASLLIGEAHQFTSIIRYFTAFGSRTKGYKLQRLPFWCFYFVVGLAILTLTLSSIGLSSQIAPLNDFIQLIGPGVITVSEIGMAFFPVFLMQHFCAQAKAMGLMYCGKNGYQLSKTEKLNLSVVAWCLVLSGAFSIAIPFASDGTGLSTLLKVNIGPVPALLVPMWHFIATAASLFLAFSFFRRGLHKGEWLPRGAAVLWANMALFVLLPPEPMVYVWLFVPVFFHASQHWTLAWATQQAELTKQGREPSNDTFARLFDICRLFLPVQAFTLAILFLPMIFAVFGGLDEELGEFSTGIGSTLNVGLSMLVFYIHYFADRIVWRPQ
jgi:hypothetical protein